MRKSDWGVIALAAALLLIVFALATGWLSGVPQTREKSVTVSYAPHADSFGVSLFMQPPLATQAQGESQLVALQFTSHASTAVHIQIPTLQSGGCFDLTPEPSTKLAATIPEVVLQPSQTSVAVYKLTAKDSCVGQHPLVLQYSWLVEPISPASFSQQAAVTTNSILVVSRSSRTWERFFHILGLVASAVLLPVLLWLLNSIYQRSQAKQDIWKAIFPGILILTQQHYLPLVRRSSLLRDLLGSILDKHKGALEDVDTGRILERALLLRAQYLRLANSFGGFHFRSKPGEELCGALFELLWARFLPFANPDYDQFLSRLLFALLPPTADLGDFIDVSSGDRSEYRLAQNALQANFGTDPIPAMEQLVTLISLLIALFGFELDRPLWPEWYKEPPLFAWIEFKEKGQLLIAQTQSNPDDFAEYTRLLQAYLKSIPSQCRDTKKAAPSEQPSGGPSTSISLHEP